MSGPYDCRGILQYADREVLPAGRYWRCRELRFSLRHIRASLYLGTPLDQIKSVLKRSSGDAHGK